MVIADDVGDQAIGRRIVVLFDYCDNFRKELIQHSGKHRGMNTTFDGGSSLVECTIIHPIRGK